MKKFRILWFVIPLLLVLQACGTVIPAPTQEAEATASIPDPVPDPDPEDTFIPYGKNIRFDQISLEEGLSQSVVNVIMQDRKGFLWIGTDDGLNRYDGYSFTVFKPDTNNPASLNDRSISALVEDQQGYLWIGTRQGGLNRYDPVSGKFEYYLHEDSDDGTIASDSIHSLYLDETGLWIGTDNGLDFLEFETGELTHFHVSEDTPPDDRSLSSNNIRVLYKDSKGLLWIGTGTSGLNVYDPQNGTFKVYSHDRNDSQTISSNRILSITEGRDGSIWIGTANGLNQFNPSRNAFRRFENSRYKEFSLAGNIVYSLHIDQTGGLWIGTNKGLDRFDQNGSKFIHHQSQPGISNSLSNNQVLSIYEDRSGVLWIGTFGGGLNKYNRQQDRFAYFRHNPNDDNSLNSNFILAILAEEKDRVWIGTLDNGLNRFEPATEKFTHFVSNPGIPASLSDNSINALYMDSSGTLWVGTGVALDQFDPVTSRFTHYQPEPTSESESANISVSAIFEDSSKQLWVGTNLGLMLFNRNTHTFTEFILGEGGSENTAPFNITYLIEDGNRNLWVGTFDDGLKRIDLDEGIVTHFRSDPNNRNSLSNNAILCLYKDAGGALWIGTHGGGLNRLDIASETFTHFTENEGLPNNVIYGILEDDSGNLWLSTNFGLSRFDSRSLTFRNFTASDGLQSNEFNQDAFARDSEGKMYFGGINGLNVFQPREIKDNPYQPNVALTAVTVDGEPIAGEQTPEYMERIVLQWPRDSFEFEFAAFAFEQPGKNKYSYMLEGFDPNWIEIGGQRNGRYTNLPGGTYTLRLRGTNSDGTWSETEKPIEVVVVPPFWETWWFGGLLIMAFGAMVAGGLRWRVKRVESRNRELERLVRLRTADLEKRNSEIEALYLADEKIIRSVTLNHIFQTLVNVSVSMLQADRSVVFTWNEARHKVVPRISQGFQPESLDALVFDRNEGMIGQAMNTGDAVVIADIDPANIREDIRAVVEREGIQSFAHFPIIVDERVVAIFNVAYTRPNALTKDSIRLFTALVNRASMAIANMELFDQTRELAVMEERNRLARDLHDSAKQKAFAALAQLGTINVMAKATPLGTSPHLNEAENLVYEVIQELNFLIQEIYPIALQEKGLPAVLREYVFEWENRNDAVINLTIQNERELPLELEQAVYRVIQEALANVSRHSRAKRVDLSLVYNNDLLQVIMADDGCGFDVNKKATGLGFRSMRERISSIRGTFQVQSAPGQGTRIFIQISLKATPTGVLK